MPTLAQKLGTTFPVSPLLRKARRLGVRSVADGMNLAAARGCRHYASAAIDEIQDLSMESFNNEELAIFLLLGEHPYEPSAIRCAAQLAGSPGIEPTRFCRLASRHGTIRPLVHIAKAGATHDPLGKEFWQNILAQLEMPSITRIEPDLPHWSRFVSSPGYQRGQIAPTIWLRPAP